ncbi:uncharacterized protein LOC117525503 isoform X4 [Thalassophryne amazonica]|uniref:uncharacterized protein LOC117525503 isoform X4 n=1 Tax=Thalassophryne amazonica TaxID=390379 RepID=UPI0014722312|nr:uncharacterized protein LOC117525503 isoform X4 [Thalassophryne amazonica]
MYKTEKLKALVNERLKAAAEEIFSLFEKTIQDYQEEVFRSKQEIDSRRRLVGCKAPLQLSVQEEEAPPEKEHCENKIDLCEVDQELAHIKEEHEELWTNQSAPLQLSVQEDDASPEQNAQQPAQIKEEHEELWTNQAGNQSDGAGPVSP